MRWWNVLAPLLLALGMASAPAQSQPATPASSAFNIDVRNAAVGDVLAQLSRVSGASLTAAGSAADDRVTLHAAAVTVPELRAALAELLRHQWRQEDHRWVLTPDPAWEERQERFRRIRDVRLLEGLQRIRMALETRPADTWAQAYLEQLRQRYPERAAFLADVTPATLRQTLLLQGLERDSIASIARNGFGWQPIWQLPPAARQTVTSFLLASLAPHDLARFSYTSLYPTAYGGLVPVVTASLLPRVEYRLLYGDRTTGQLLLIRAGLPDTWAAAFLPALLVDVPQARELYLPTAGEVTDPVLVRRLRQRINFAGRDWEEALATFARAANVKVIADGYLRPDIFPRERGEAPDVLGLTISQALDRLADYYGMFWWYRDGWFYFRHRDWVDLRRVAVPESALRALSRDLGGQAGLTEGAAATLAALPDEQLLSLHLHGSAAGAPTAPVAAFDLNQIQFIQRALAFYRTLDEEQRQLALTSGLYAYQMRPDQQSHFAAIGWERGYPVDPTVPGAVFFRVHQTLRPDSTRENGTPYRGTLQFVFSFGPGAQRTGGLALRLPASSASGPNGAAPPRAAE